MDKESPASEQLEVHRVWVSDQERIASFHEVHAYKLEIIKGHEAYVKYLQFLQEQGFRFQ